ncbi:MAG: sugar dehydratase [Acidobacteria bacterium]|nr:sugar dehydratase [Acidobacteriota bacterium]
MSSFWQDRPVFVTGATGLVGSWLIRRLITHGAEPVCLVRDWIPQSELVSTTLLEQVRVVRGDVRDQELLERTLGEYEVATVMHLAAQTIVGVANRNPVSTLDTNIRGTWALLEACRRSSTVQQIVLASSDKAYGAQEVLPYSETTPLEGRHPYDVSKSCTDLIAQMYAKTYELPVTITRCGNFYGGGDLNWNRLVPGTIRSLLRGESPEIRSDGKSIRDYFFVEDGAAAYMLLAEKMASQPEFFGEAFNFSNEQQVSVLDLVTKIVTIMGLNIKPNVRNEASNEILIQHLDASKAKNLLSWSPTFTLEAGLQETVKWYEHYFSNTTTGH